ncbi:MAG: DoxX family protein [Nocardioidaceae bacterium]
MRALGSSGFGRAADLGPLLMRVGIGSVFAWHGWLKFDGGVSNWADTLDSLNVPAPLVMAWVQIIAEGVGGVLLILGLFTRLAALALIVDMIGAIWLVKVDVGFIVSDAAGAELDVALLSGLLGLLFIGSGRLAFDAILGMETSAVHLSSGARRQRTAA